MIWIAFATMTAAVALLLVWPLARRDRPLDAKGADLAFYKSQLADVQGEVDRGVVAADEAAATRTEIVRRLLASARGPEAEPATQARAPRLAAIAAAVLLVPAGALALYLRLGHPGEPDAPLEARAAGPEREIATALPRIEAHLAVEPDDGRGWSLIAPIYMRTGRYDDAAKAYENALRTLGEDANRRAALGQALTMAADGVVTTGARAAFDRALVDDPKLPEARFFQAIAAEQDADHERAVRLWTALAADSPADAPWRPSVEQHLASLTGQPPPMMPPAPNGGAGAAIAALPPAQQRQAIHGMVDGLAARLAQNGRDVDGWLRLIRAYKVLGEQDKARIALADARHGLDGDTASLTRIDALGRELGLES